MKYDFIILISYLEIKWATVTPSKSITDQILIIMVAFFKRHHSHT